uniref:Uncharacterized protein n=1 Tax=Cairina moschata TaxID=8855 RepID=A0A8C3C644_CAIMO
YFPPNFPPQSFIPFFLFFAQIFPLFPQNFSPPQKKKKFWTPPKKILDPPLEIFTPPDVYFNISPPFPPPPNFPPLPFSFFAQIFSFFPQNFCPPPFKKINFCPPPRAVGCIFGELLNLSPLFPGENDIEQLCCVLRALGTPSPSVWPALLHPFFFGPLELSPPPWGGPRAPPPQFRLDAPLQPALPPPAALAPLGPPPS